MCDYHVFIKKRNYYLVVVVLRMAFDGDRNNKAFFLFLLVVSLALGAGRKGC